MGWNPVITAAALVALALAVDAPVGGHTAAAAIIPVQLIPAPHPDAGPGSEPDHEEGDSQDEEDEHGSSHHEDLRDGILRMPRTGDDEAVKVPPAEQLPPSPQDRRRRE